MKAYWTYDEQQAIAFKHYLEETTGQKVTVTPVAEEFRKVGDDRPVKVKWYVKVGELL